MSKGRTWGTEVRAIRFNKRLNRDKVEFIMYRVEIAEVNEY